VLQAPVWESLETKALQARRRPFTAAGRGDEYDEEATPTCRPCAGGGCVGLELFADAPCAADNRARHVASRSRTAGVTRRALLVTILRICRATEGYDFTEGALRPLPTIPRQGGVSAAAPGPKAFQPERRSGGV
jgi:hypothetical protein